jgi:predicted acyltransferase
MASTASSPSGPAVGRIASLDALRGFDMFWIVGGHAALIAVLGIFPTPLPDWLKELKAQLSHARWEGFTAWDLIMPLFLFVVGAAMPLAFAKRWEGGATTGSMYWRVIRRVVVLWVLGMAVQGNLLVADQTKGLFLFSNTLQSIAVGYLVASILLMHLPVLGQVIVAALLLVGYWLLMILVPFNGHAAGTLEETVNLARHIDELVLGQFRDGTTYTWLLSGMGFAAMVLMGVFAGHVLRSAWSGLMKVVWLVLLGGLCLALGWFWAGGYDNLDQLGNVTLVGAWRFPIIKHLFTSSMVLWAAGWCYLLLALFYLLIDVLRMRWLGFVFEVIGANAIFAYVGWGLFHSSFQNVANTLLGGLARYFGALPEPMPAIGQALGPVGAVIVLWLVLYYMYRKGTFLRV